MPAPNASPGRDRGSVGCNAHLPTISPGVNELLYLAIVCAALVKGGIALDLRPEELRDAVLGHGIPQDRPAGGSGGGGARGQGGAEARLHIELPKPLAAAQVGLNAGIGRAVLVTAGGDGGQYPCAQRVTAVYALRRKGMTVRQKLGERYQRSEEHTSELQ